MEFEPLLDKSLETIINCINKTLGEILQRTYNLQPQQKENVRQGAIIQIFGRIDYGNFFPEEDKPLISLQQEIDDKKGDNTRVGYLYLHESFEPKFQG